MHVTRKQKLVAAGVAAVAAAGGGAAIAASKFGSPSEESTAVVNDAANRLGIQPSALSDALKKALEDRVDAAVTAGRLTQAQGDAIKSRIESGEFPLFFAGHGGGFDHHGFGGLDAAAAYLGLTAAELRTQLESGKTLAQVAQAKGKSVDGLIQAMIDDVKTHLDAAVKAARLTQAQEDSILANLKQRITDLVNGTLPRGPLGFRTERFGGGPPGI